MVQYALRAVPWARVAVAAALVVGLMEVVRRWPFTTWPLEGTVVGLLAGGVAWCFDEPAASVVDAAPRGIGWRTVARLSGVAVLLGCWSISVYVARDSLFGHPWHVAGHGYAAALAAVAWCVWRRASGDPTPGLRTASVLLPLAAAWAVVRPLSEALPVFPYADGSGDSGSWEVSAWLWLSVALASAVLLTFTLAHARWWAVRRVPSVDGSGCGDPFRVRAATEG